MTEESNLVSIEEIREEDNIREALADMSKEETENALVRMISINNAAAARIDALEHDLQRTRDFLERERKINKAIKRKKGKKNIEAGDAANEPWHELVDGFDPKRITRLPIEGRVFLVGYIDDVFVVEVPAESTRAEIIEFREGLNKLGMTSAAVIVKEGTRFLKLRPVGADQRKALEARMEEIRVKEAAAATAGEDGAEAEDGQTTPPA